MAEEKKLDPHTLKEHIGKHLRTADEFTRFQRYEEAVREIELALQLDPKHNYARSFMERVKLMQKRSQQKEAEQAPPAEISLEERMGVIAQHLADAEEHINKKEFKLALEEVAKVYQIDPKNYYAQSYSEKIDSLMLEENKESNKIFKTAIQTPQPGHEDQSSPVQQERGSTLMYLELLKDVWLDGKVTEDEAQQLTAMRELFGIPYEYHLQLEKQIKIDAYLDALRIAWRDNTMTDLEQKALQTMCSKYGITAEEQAIAELRYAEIKRSSKSRGTILLVDSDREMLVSLAKVLKQRGFSILMAQKVVDALQILLTQTPSIILSEVLFPNSSMDGVGFLTKAREHSALKKVPFFFLSSLSDKKIIQASYRLGADQFLVKPIDTEMLLSMIEGKLQLPA